MDLAIAECMGMTRAAESESSESSLVVLNELKERLIEVGNQLLDQVQLQRNKAGVPLPAWLPRTILDAGLITDGISARQALSNAIRRPCDTNIPSLVSAIQKATSQGGSRTNTPSISESARPSGLTSAERSGFTSSIHQHNTPWSPASMQDQVAEPVSHARVSLLAASSEHAAAYYRIGSQNSRAPGSKAARNAAFLAELARAKQARLQAE